MPKIATAFDQLHRVYPYRQQGSSFLEGVQFSLPIGGKCWLPINNHRASVLKIVNGDVPIIKNRALGNLAMGMLRMTGEIGNQTASTNTASATPTLFSSTAVIQKTVQPRWIRHWTIQLALVVPVSYWISEMRIQQSDRVLRFTFFQSVRGCGGDLMTGVPKWTMKCVNM